jgi:hypothetical protein
MNALTNTPITPAADDASDAAAAFRTLNLRIAGQTAAIEGFAARQQEIFGRDYRDDLAKIQAEQVKAWEAILTLNARPAMALTPKDITAQLAEGGRSVRASDHDALTIAYRRFDAATADLNALVSSAKTAEAQRTARWDAVCLSGTIGMAIGAALLAFLSTPLANALPADWRRPEAIAAQIMRTDEWDAGWRLLEAGNQRGANLVADSFRIMKDNIPAIDACRMAAAPDQQVTSCTIQLYVPRLSQATQ